MQTEPIRDREKLKEFAEHFLSRGQYRNYALFILGTHTALRVSDLLQLKWDEVYDEKRGDFYSHIYITEEKTGKQKSVALHRHTVETLRLLLPQKKNDYIFANNRKEPAPICREQAWRIIKSAAEILGFKECIAFHSLRKTFGYQARVKGASEVVLMDIFNHASFETTKRYLGLTQDEKDKVYMELDLF